MSGYYRDGRVAVRTTVVGSVAVSTPTHPVWSDVIALGPLGGHVKAVYRERCRTEVQRGFAVGLGLISVMTSDSADR